MRCSFEHIDASTVRCSVCGFIGKSVLPVESIRRNCPGWNSSLPARGLGDTIAKVTTALGIKPCGGCKKRQEALNKLIRYQ